MDEYDIIEALTDISKFNYKCHSTLDNLYVIAGIVGLHDRDNHALRVKWINNLRMIVGRRIPKNVSGVPLTSDVDLMTATADEMTESILRTVGKWIN